MADEIEKLMELMQEDLQRHRELAQILDNKLDAMRHRDIPRLEALAVAEHRLVGLISTHSKKRCDILRQATEKYFPGHGKKLATARELAQAAGGAARDKLLAISAMLADVTRKVQSLNQVNTIASQKILGHVDHIFRIIAQSGRDIGLYGRAGKKAPSEQNRLVDAIA